MSNSSRQISEIEKMLEGIPETTSEMLDAIAEVNQQLNNDPDFVADLERAKFVNVLLVAMEEQQMTRADLAKAIGKTRQYVQKVLDEDARVSFTLKTMIRLCHALDKKLQLKIEDRSAIDSCIQFPVKKYREGSTSIFGEYAKSVQAPTSITVAEMVLSEMHKDSKMGTQKFGYEHDISLSA